jgi:hypothetical protein
MNNTLRTAGLAVLTVGISALVAVVLATPATAGAMQALRTGHASAGPEAAWPTRASLLLAGRLDWILRLVRCPTIQNNE